MRAEPLRQWGPLLGRHGGGHHDPALQFYGYDPSNPVDPDILALVEDVLARWMAEKECVGSVGRVLPKEYLYFTGDGAHNYFTTEWQGRADLGLVPGKPV